MKHLFKATKLGWAEEKEGIWFDSDYYPRKRQNPNSSHTTALPKMVFPMSGTNSTVRSITM